MEDEMKARDWLIQIHKNYKGSAFADFRGYMVEAAKSDEEAWEDIFNYWFAAAERSIAVEETEDTIVVRPVKHYSVRVRATRTKKSVQELTNFIVSKVCLPDGTPLLQATFGQCKQAGSWFTSIAKHGKANEVVGKKLTNKELENLWRRTL
jgi:hypothetical protein